MSPTNRTRRPPGRLRRVATTGLVLAAMALVGCEIGPAPSARMSAIPQLMLWAWERPEDLSYISPETTGVAFLAATVTLRGDAAESRARLQPLRFPPGTTLMGVVRVEVELPGGADLSSPQRRAIVDRVVGVSTLAGVAAVQVDLDARVSERDFYRLLLADIRAALPPAMPLSITSLASWAMDDNWMVGLPVDEIVPMLFRMGSGGPAIVAYARRHGRLRGHPSGGAVGYATDEPRPPMHPRGRTYIFCPAGWDERVYAMVAEEYLP